MAIGIENFPNIVPADADYLSGDIKDTPSGTPVNRNTNGDIQQFFRKLMRIAGITPNNLRDNETNGFQLITALQKAARPYNSYTVALTQAGVAAPTAVIMENNLSGTVTLGRSGIGLNSLTLTGEFTSTKTVAFISMQTLNRVGKISRFSNDSIILLVHNDAGVDADVWSAYVEVRVYR